MTLSKLVKTWSPSRSSHKNACKCRCCLGRNLSYLPCICRRYHPCVPTSCPQINASGTTVEPCIDCPGCLLRVPELARLLETPSCGRWKLCTSHKQLVFPWMLEIIVFRNELSGNAASTTSARFAVRCHLFPFQQRSDKVAASAWQPRAASSSANNNW